MVRALPRGQWWWKAAVLGTLNIGAFFALLFVSAYRLPGGVAAVLGAAQPLLVAGLGVVLLVERVPLRTLLAAVTAAVGVGLTVLTAAARLDSVGVVAGLAGTASMGLGLVLTKSWGRPVPVLTMTAWQPTAGGLLLLALLSPVVATVIGWAVLAQSLTPLQVLGMVVALGGVIAAQRRPRDTAPASSTPTTAVHNPAPVPAAAA